MNAGAFSAGCSSTGSSPLKAGASLGASSVAVSSPLNAGAFSAGCSSTGSSPLKAGASLGASSVAVSSPLNAGALVASSVFAFVAKIALLYAARASAPLNEASLLIGLVTTSVFCTSSFFTGFKTGASTALKLIGFIILSLPSTY